uniref:Uncharacterized protein n=1 Tax=Zosterops lateralis melanops TaxID=1220523 RepID=A0A8D2P3B9_ZOSLA
MGHGLFGAGCHHLCQQPTVTLGAEGKSDSRKTKLGFIESRLQLVVKSAEDMPWCKQALKMMLQGKAKAAIPVSNAPAFRKSELGTAVECSHTVISDPK